MTGDEQTRIIVTAVFFSLVLGVRGWLSAWLRRREPSSTDTERWDGRPEQSRRLLGAWRSSRDSGAQRSSTRPRIGPHR